MTEHSCLVISFKMLGLITHKPQFHEALNHYKMIISITVSVVEQTWKKLPDYICHLCDPREIIELL